MANIRVHELSKKLGVPNKKIIEELEKLDIRGKTHSSNIDEAISKKIEQLLKIPRKSTPPAKPVAKEQIKKVVKTVKAEKEKVKVKEKKPTVKIRKPRPTPSPPVEEVAPPPVAEIPPVSVESPPLPADKAKEELVEEIKIVEEEEVKIPDRFKDKLFEPKGKEIPPRQHRPFKEIKRKWLEIKAIPKKFEKPKHIFKKSELKKADVKVIPLPTLPRKKVVKLTEGMTAKDFAEAIGQKVGEVIKKFMELGFLATINQPIDMDASILVADSFGIKAEVAPIESDESILEEVADEPVALQPRAPVVTIMGHVDHGKTSLLDAIRETKLAETEAGGITQHIGAYKVTLKGKDIVFLDTPGHEAFTSMRARGAKVTDVVVLVVAADDGVMPQTKEAINHAMAANVPIVVAINKIDKGEANPLRVKQELSELGLIPEKWGGQTIVVEVSAKKRIGIENLLEMILLQAEMLELKANPDKRGRGTVIEAKLDRGRGPVATVLVQAGTLKVGEAFITGSISGKVRALMNDKGMKIDEAVPSTPVEVLGLPDVPQAGDSFIVVEDERKARNIALLREQRQKSEAISKVRKLTLDDLYAKIKEGAVKELPLIVKADVQGSVEAVRDALERLGTDAVKVKMIHGSVGGITETDVMLASASNAIIIGFNIRPEPKASSLAEKEGVDIRLYNVIYDAISDVRAAMEGLLEPTFKEKVVGRAEVRQTFNISKVGTVAGCYAVDGLISRSNTSVRVIRDSVVIYEGKIASLRRFKEDVKEVQSGYECGILVENFNDIKIGDILEVFTTEKVAAKL
ncbi:MAG: translation initiation factor IF-2 [Nitrospirota bacterium]